MRPPSAEIKRSRNAGGRSGALRGCGAFERAMNAVSVLRIRDSHAVQNNARRASVVVLKISVIRTTMTASSTVGAADDAQGDRRPVDRTRR